MSDTVKAWIEERRVVIDGEVRWFTKLGDAHKALDALNAVRELHVRDSLMRDYCSECSDFGTDDSPVMSVVEYPCSTVQAIEGAIKGEH